MAFLEPHSGALARIKVVGVGGAGQNAIGTMLELNNVSGVEFIAMNTDLQALNSSPAEIRLQLGPEKTGGLGSGANPEVGKEASLESYDDIKAYLQGADMVFIAAGMGGGTGTGAAPIVAEMARELGALTVGVVTKPFSFEGKRRMNVAEQGIRELKDKVDALIVIPDEKILEVVDTEVALTDAFKLSDQVIGNAVEGISDLITSTGLVNVDFADVKAIMTNAGSALMGIGESNSEKRAEEAATEAINSPLLDVDIKGSTGVLINIVGDSTITMHEVNTAAKVVSEASHEAANIIFGANIDPNVEGIKVTVIATGFDSEFKSIGLPNMVSINDEDVLSQIDSRHDSSEDEEEEAFSEEPIAGHEEYESASDTDTNSFDIEKLREQVKMMENDKTAGDDESNEDEAEVEDNHIETNEEGPGDSQQAGSFWKNFIKDRRK